MKIGNAIGLIAMVVMLSGCAENIDNVVYSDNQTQVDSQESVQLLIDEKETDDVYGANSPLLRVSRKLEVQPGIVYRAYDIRLPFINRALHRPRDTQEVEELLENIRNGASEELCQELYENQISVSIVPDIVKQWNRTDVHSSHSAVLDVKAVDNTGFVFKLDAYYYYHTGNVEGKAYFVSENCAVFRLEEMELPLPEEEYEYIVFVFENDEVTVYASASSAELGLGMNVYVYGSYIDGEPIYTNAEILEETYTDAQLAFLRDNLPTDYYDKLIFATEFGGVGVTDEDGKRVVSVTVPTAGQYGYVVNIVDEAINSIIFGDGTEFSF